MKISKEKKLEREKRRAERESDVNKKIVVHERRPNGTLRISTDYSKCLCTVDQIGWKETHIPSLVKKHTPDTLAAYIAGRNQHRPEIKGHDFSLEPNKQDAMNCVYDLKQGFQNLPDHIRRQFGNVTEFLKFIDNPQNVEQMIEMKILTRKQINKITDKLEGKQEIEATTTNDDASKPA